MNIELLLEKIASAERLLVDSGLKRDLEAWTSALGQADVQNNLVRLKEISEKALEGFASLEEGGLREVLDKILPTDETVADLEVETKLEELTSDPSADTSTFHSRLLNILNQVNSTATQNIARLKELKNTFAVYVPAQEAETAMSGKALLAIIFNDSEVIYSLPHFAKKLSRWDRTLRMYHSLVTNESPEDIGLTGVHGGSIDVVVNLNLDVALDITEVMRYGFIALSAYLSYRIAKSDLVKSYGKNKELLELDKKQDELMLANIKRSMEDALKERYLKEGAKSKKVATESPEVKIEQISDLFSEHIAKGNDIKLLTSGEKDSDEAETTGPQPSEALRDESLKARALRKQVSSKDLKLLTAKYSSHESDDEEQT
ncbi:MAG: hypothetical protein IT174_17505 [Acidobacteria bacterium]|nr:hypothetical protein [Acidobacteriota bacterium]